MKFLIREALLEDVESIADVHVESWFETYRGIIPDSYLSKLSKSQKQEMWEKVISMDEGGLFVAETSNSVVGFIYVGRSREKDYGHEGEVYAIYLLKGFHGKGIGRELFEKGKEWFRQNNLNSFLLWVLKDNKTIEFYEKAGGTYLLERLDDFDGVTLDECLYFWK